MTDIPGYDTIRWEDDKVILIDQRRLPDEETYLTCTDYREVVDAIRTLAIRGAPAIGVAAAMAAALGALSFPIAIVTPLNAISTISARLSRQPGPPPSI